MRRYAGCAKVTLNDSTPADLDAHFILLEALCIVLAATHFFADFLFCLCGLGVFICHLGSLSAVQTFLEYITNTDSKWCCCFRTASHAVINPCITNN